MPKALRSRERQLRSASQFFKMAGQETRIRILQTLAKRPTNVSQLVSIVGADQPNVSHHLRLMSVSGLVTGARDGKCVVYSVTESGKGLADLVESLLS